MKTRLGMENNTVRQMFTFSIKAREGPQVRKGFSWERYELRITGTRVFQV